ncbi:MFS transporter [Vitreoscilla sp. C1]|uniref:MFS transporter n=1 Tax=Vitreoscilla sp. (strain C1) TaxID=96942 RepID=UPI00148E93D1|nr:MFS transporter [Vitreoscilla sp. C1]AUZ05013.2 MFS transporter [Vitreoscilla sp. C1]
MQSSIFQQRNAVEYLILSLSLCLGVMSTALASPLYAIYVTQWHLSTTEVGYAFITYMIGVVFSLLFLNGLAGKHGYKKEVMLGLFINIMALAYSALANNIWHLCTSRFLIGIASGLLTTATMNGLSDKYPFPNKAKAGKLSSIVTVIGFSLGPIFGGLVADSSQTPLSTPYWIVCAGSIVVFLACFGIRYQHQTSHKLIKPRMWNTPKTSENKRIFWPYALAASACFGVFSLYAALAGSMLAQLPLPKSATLTGLSISIILFISTIVQMTCKGMKESLSLSFGMILLTLGCLGLILLQLTHANLWLAISIISIGIGHGLSLNPAYYLIDKISRAENPAIFSTFLLVGYQGTIWPILLSSKLIDLYGYLVSLSVFAGLVTAIFAWVAIQIRSH